MKNEIDFGSDKRQTLRPRTAVVPSAEPLPDGDTKTKRDVHNDVPSAAQIRATPSPVDISRRQSQPPDPVRETAPRVSPRDGTQSSNPRLYPESAPVRLSPGVVVPGTRYRLDAWIGEGGMGVVYSATHIEIHRRAALKVLNLDLRHSPEASQSFRDEARASARIGAANIVEVYDLAVMPDGRVALAMELLEGRSLDDTLTNEHVLEPARLIALLRQVCKGLAAAHDAGIVHRDIKPGNIMLTRREGRDDFVKIVDFGIAAALNEEQASPTAGTPDYMAPELILGEASDARADMYAVGCVAYECLTGRPPFLHANVAQVLHMHVEHEVVAPHLVAQVLVPAALEKVVMRCLSKKPQDRYASMTDLEAALCEAQIQAKLTTDWDDLPLPSVEETRLARLVRQMPLPRRRARPRWFVPLVVAAGVSLLVGGGAVFFALSQPDPSAARRSDELTDLAQRARHAASRAIFVYPPATSPEADTAYLAVLDLEGRSLEGSEQLARGLRSEFAQTLTRLGDEYWDKSGGRTFAVDYYAQALIFDPANRQASNRAPISPGQLVVLQDKAARREFSATELEAVEPLVALAEPDPEIREAAITEIVRKRKARPRPKASDDLTRLLGTGETDLQTAAPPPATPQPSPGDVVVAPEPPGTDASSPPEKQKPSTDSATATRLAQQGREELRGGDFASAEKTLHRALKADPRSVAALRGLGDLYFDRGRYSRSAKYRNSAARYAPKNSEVRLELGDAYFKVMRYEDALQEYRMAKSLGHKAAAGRIAKVNQRVGEN